jgi:hypothetical protein
MATRFESDSNPHDASIMNQANTTGYNFGEFVTPIAQATQRRIELERIADDEKRTGRYSETPRTAAPSEIEKMLRLAQMTSAPEPGNYDESQEGIITPNYRDLARGGAGKRSILFQTGERTDDSISRQPDRRKRDRRDHETRGSRPHHRGRYK